MKDKLKITWLDKLKDKWGYLIYKMMGVRYGPLMFKVGPDWWFIDHYGTVWEIKYTGETNNPLIIHLRWK